MPIEPPKHKRQFRSARGLIEAVGIFDASLPDFEERSNPAGSVPTLDELVSGITD